MSAVFVMSSILTLVAGIGIFLVACQMMSENLESASSSRLKLLFSRASKSKMIGVGIGALGTAAIQSSGATTVMTIGFVNAGIISLAQAATIIYGANIGTTITAQIVALGMFGGNSLSTSVIFSALAGIGAFVSLFSKKANIKTLGGILTGFGMLFVGLDLMSDSMADFAALEGVKAFLAQIGNPVLLVLIGAVLTAIIQSSSVMTSIALAMVVTQLIELNQGIYLTMGSNIGSCVVAIIAGLTSSNNAKRTALIHLVFNISGVVVFMLVDFVIRIVSNNGLNYGVIFQRAFPDVPQTQLAMFHTIFNVVTVLLILPLTEVLVGFVCRIIPEKSESNEDGPRLFYIDDNMLKTPPVAVQQTKKEIVNMASIAMNNFNRSVRIITTMSFSEEKQFAEDERILNFLNSAIIAFVVKLSQKPLSEKDYMYLASTYRTVRDLERIGDYAENIVEYADSLHRSNDCFSVKAVDEISFICSKINALYEQILKTYQDEDLEAYHLAEGIEDEIDEYEKRMENNHIKRLSEGVCTPSVGAEYLSLASNAERIADHLINMGKVVKVLV